MNNVAIIPIKEKRKRFYRLKKKMKKEVPLQPKRSKISQVLFGICVCILFAIFAIVTNVLLVCRHQNSMALNISEVMSDLKSKLKQQHLVIENLEKLFYSQQRIAFRQPLTICFIGGTGVGKTFAAEMIMHHMPLQSHVHKFIMSLHFNKMSEEDVYKFLLNVIKPCGPVLIILEEMEHADKVVIKSIIRFLSDIHNPFFKINKNVIIIITLHTDNITQVSGELIQAGINLDEVTNKNFPLETISDNITQKLLIEFRDNDINTFTFIFLPIQGCHIRNCLSYLHSQKISSNVTDALIANLETDENWSFFLKDGCKGVLSALQLEYNN